MISLRTLLISALCIAHALCSTSFVNEKIVRKIDLRSQIVKITYTITLADHADLKNGKYIFVSDPEFEKSLSYITAMSKLTDPENSRYTIDEKLVGSAKEHQISISHKTFYVVAIFTHKLIPYPSEILQSERQFVRFAFNSYYNSIYKTIEEETTLILPSPANIVSYSDGPQPVSTVENKLTYGPYKNHDASSQIKLQVHYENNEPFIVASNLIRHIEISHWGNIAVEESVDLYHNGAKLKGSFSRFEYQRNMGGLSAVKGFTTILPASAKDVYYRDEIGNISTSHLRELPDAVELELQPRFPLFGGWKTRYVIGYNIPTYEYLFRHDSSFTLRMRFVDHIFDEQIIDSMTLKVVFPEEATNIRFIPPFSVKRGSDELIKTYLDTTGRTVLIANKNNLIEQHIQEFEVKYDFNQILMLREPFLLIGAFYILFIAVIVWMRLDFSISKDKDKEIQLRSSSICDDIRIIQDKRSALYQSYEDAINKYKNTKDEAAFSSCKKKVDSDHASLTTQLNALGNKLKSFSASSSDKIEQIEKLDSAYRSQISNGFLSAQRLVNGKIQKQSYIEAENVASEEKQRICQKIEALLGELC